MNLYEKYLNRARASKGQAESKAPIGELQYTVLKPCSVQQLDCAKMLNPGDIVSLPEDLALDLLNEGKAWPIGRNAFKVYSEALQAHLWLVATPEDAAALRASGEPIEAVYTMDEVQELQGKPPEHLRAVDAAKREFPGSTIIKRRGGKKP